MEFLYAGISLVAGIVVGALGFKFGLKSKADGILKEAKLKGDAIKEKKISQAKQKFFELKEKQKSERKDLDRKLKDREEISPSHLWSYKPIYFITSPQKGILGKGYQGISL